MSIVTGHIPSNKPSHGSIRYYICDTEIELPAGLNGDIAYTKDSSNLWVYNGAWTVLSGGGSNNLKLDDLLAPDDNTDLNASVSAHGLLPKLTGDITHVFRGNGTYGPIKGSESTQTVDITGTLSPDGIKLLLVETTVPSTITITDINAPADETVEQHCLIQNNSPEMMDIEEGTHVSTGFGTYNVGSQLSAHATWSPTLAKWILS